MSKIEYIRMSGAGNVFTIIDTRFHNYEFSKKQVHVICNKEETKCDQFIVIDNSQKADIAMTIFNNDGSRVGMCGNASRCVASLIMDQKSQDKISIETDNDILECKKNGQNIEVNMGIPRFNWRQIPLKKDIKSDRFRLKHRLISDWEFIAVNMGNPHIVTFLEEDISDEIFFEIGPFLENHPLFPERTNVEFARIIGPNHIKVRVWERGVGETPACGSGACGVAAVAIKKSLVDPEKEVIISFSGGDIIVNSNITGSLNMIGGYTYIGRNQLSL